MAASKKRTSKAQLAGPLLDYLARRIRAEAEAEFIPFGLRPRHVIALTLLRDFGERSQSDLAQALGIEPTNLVILLNELESMGLVERRRSTEDRRRHIVTLTDTGADKLADVETVVADIENRMFSTLTADDRDTLHTLLQRAAAAASGGPETPAAGPT
ncbi:MarR family winged helix-turn-helix transcriptional regulator [Mycolicibacterium sp. HK-90]|uniref:MarR family winged helix-turn-helix transcriptional regulator n=1 Tax=Mycolicibacterium sp. HK-90 TaxID=3056937 RepID=UPI002659A21B|nr:MarR family winged helix-turn-helix transcriptional regulator [Mycolicibacterium sp. HK-90]WKG04112.1 MarR family winged helix-turn-helix transcriptional regulator [Mycolicibacterium sp. HK-90]